jgi:hypothetical protein
MNLYQVLLDPRCAAPLGYLIRDLADIRKLDTGETVIQLTCTDVNPSGAFLELHVSEPGTGVPRLLFLNPGFVVAILETMTHRTLPGFVRPEGSPEQ